MTPERRLRLGSLLGLALFIIGSLDPLEGSGLIALGGALLALVAHGRKAKRQFYFKLAAILLIVGVALLWIMSSLGGFGGENGLAWGWAWVLLPYPAGWLLMIVLLIRGLFGRRDWGYSKPKTI